MLKLSFAVNEMKTWNFNETLKDDESVIENSVNPPNVYGFAIRHIMSMSLIV